MRPRDASTSAKRRPWRRGKVFWGLVGVPMALLMILAVAAAPVLYKSFNAYQDVSVDSVERDTSAFVPALNDAGTPELVAAPMQRDIPEWSGTDPVTILLLGVDKSERGASRTDTIILVNIDPVARTASMLSIPRDLKVVIPGYGINKINAAFALGEFNKVQGGGAGLTIRTIEANLGVPVHHFAQIDFDGFVRMIDTVGGITIDVPYPLRDDEYPADNYQYQRIYFPSGWQHLGGERALQYARTRHQDGDQRRSERQQQVLLALRDQAVDLDLISKLPTLIGQFGDSVRTDISVDSAIRLARLGTEIPRDQITQFSLMPSLYEEQLPDEPYYLVADWDETGEILSDFAGTTINPPGAALANPDYSLPILILNGTDNEGLAGRVGDVLEWNGFWNVDVALAEGTGGTDRSTVIDNGNYLGTSALITNLIGVGADQISVTSLPSSTSTVEVTPTPTSVANDDVRGIFAGIGTSASGRAVDEYDPDDYAIVITLGEDAPDPAGSELQLEEYQDQVEGEAPSVPVDQAPTDETGE
jgi:LCP family protein required for cell wall assembly